MIKLKVYPNTGHQFFEVPLRELLPKKSPDWLEDFAWANRGPWQTWDAYAKWVRHQYDTVDGEPTLKLAIETNLGLASRGHLFDIGDEVVEDPPEEDEIILPYAATDEAQIEEEYGADRVMPLNYLPNKDGRDIEVPLAVYWPRGAGSDPIDVDLIVDLGNSRTVALLLENAGPENNRLPFGRRVRILRFIPRGTPYKQPEANIAGTNLEDDCAIIDSWLILHRTLFAASEPPASEDKIVDLWEGYFDPQEQKRLFRNKRYLPHAFVELSPALIGGGKSPYGAAKILSSVSLDHDARFSLSSPKRYVWDDQPQGVNGGTVWKQIPNDTDAPPPDFFDDLGGLVRFFMDPGGIDWDIDHPIDEDDFRGMPFLSARPHYPRRDAICWFALSVIEQAYRQINALGYLQSTGRESLPRRLRNIRVTYPAGWTDEERSRYLAQWQRAINLFTLTRFPDHQPIIVDGMYTGGDRPVLANPQLDEAVCSQLPILYADIKSLFADAEGWFELMGFEGRTTVMNVDIGGGTTDLAIIEYSNAGDEVDTSARQQMLGSRTHASIQPRLLFRDGNKVAGDMLVKRIIEQVLLPAWMEAAGTEPYENAPGAREWVLRLFTAPAHNEFSNVDPKASQKLMRVIRLAFIPIVNEWLRRLGENSSSWEPLKVADFTDPTTVNDLNALVDKVVRRKTMHGDRWRGKAFPLEDISLKCDKVVLERCIDEVFGAMFDSLAKLAGRFQCQMVIISGKPSELPRVRDLIVRAFPLPPQRIVPMKHFPAGSWYPFSSFDGGKIQDAKTCTVVGAALFQDICNGGLEGFSIREEAKPGLSRRYYWGLISRTAMPEEFYNSRNLLFSPRDYPAATPSSRLLKTERTFPMFPLNSRIGRQIIRITDTAPDPVYRLSWRPAGMPPSNEAYAKVTLRWVSEVERGERLELVKVETIAEYPFVEPADVSLELNTMLEDSFWLDEPELDLTHLRKGAP
ncbi:MAG: virulence factor SrfB [Verrucomicrobiota bacterium]